MNDYRTMSRAEKFYWKCRARVRRFLIMSRIMKLDCDDYIECGCINKDDEHCMFCCYPKKYHVDPKDETWEDVMEECFPEQSR